MVRQPDNQPDQNASTFAPSLQTRLRDWIHETPLSLCSRGADTCPDWLLADALAHAIRSNTDEAWQAAQEVVTRRHPREAPRGFGTADYS